MKYTLVQKILRYLVDTFLSVYHIQLKHGPFDRVNVLFIPKTLSVREKAINAFLDPKNSKKFLVDNDQIITKK